MTGSREDGQEKQHLGAWALVCPKNEFALNAGFLLADYRFLLLPLPLLRYKQTNYPLLQPSFFHIFELRNGRTQQKCQCLSFYLNKMTDCYFVWTDFTNKCVLKKTDFAWKEMLTTTYWIWKLIAFCYLILCSIIKILKDFY